VIDLALHFAPHPDDELIGAPATLMALRDAGWRVVNLACGLGRPEQRRRREAELREACSVAGFELLIPEAPVGLSGADDRGAAATALRDLIRAAIEELAPRIVLSPSPHDRHPAHELVARALAGVLAERSDPPPRWWMWALWGALPLPSLGTGFDRARLDQILAALSAHRGELRRNDYRLLVKARAVMNAALGPELLFGFGAERRPDVPYAELLTDVALQDKRWLLGPPRWLDPKAPLPDPTERELGDGLLAPSEPIKWRLGGDPA
jgi:LmbE family N-acetylglucosaminyl deacetylase